MLLEWPIVATAFTLFLLKLRQIIIPNSGWDKVSSGYVVLWAVRRHKTSFRVVAERHKQWPFSVTTLNLPVESREADRHSKRLQLDRELIMTKKWNLAQWECLPCGQLHCVFSQDIYIRLRGIHFKAILWFSFIRIDSTGQQMRPEMQIQQIFMLSRQFYCQILSALRHNAKASNALRISQHNRSLCWIKLYALRCNSPSLLCCPRKLASRVLRVGAKPQDCFRCVHCRRMATLHGSHWERWNYDRRGPPALLGEVVIAASCKYHWAGK